MFRLACVLILSILLFSCGDNASTPDYDNSLPKAPSVPPPVPMMYKVLNVYPHDPSSFTQGLEFHNGKIYEGTGNFNTSKLRIVDIKTGNVEKNHTITDPGIFGEGITILNNKIFQLTWQNNKIFEYKLDDFTKPVKTYTWSREGWGLTNNGHQLIISDGTAQLFFVTPDEASGKMQIDKIITVRNNLGPVDSLNELELINGSVFANRWLTNDIVQIDTSNGYVTGMLSFKGLMQQYAPGVMLKDGAVLNGIAYDSAQKKIYITGKDWPKMFEIELMNP